MKSQLVAYYGALQEDGGLRLKKETSVGGKDERCRGFRVRENGNIELFSLLEKMTIVTRIHVGRWRPYL